MLPNQPEHLHLLMPYCSTLTRPSYSRSAVTEATCFGFPAELWCQQKRNLFLGSCAGLCNQATRSLGGLAFLYNFSVVQEGITGLFFCCCFLNAVIFQKNSGILLGNGVSHQRLLLVTFCITTEVWQNHLSLTNTVFAFGLKV